MGNVTMKPGATDARVTEYLAAYFERERELLEEMRADPRFSKEDIRAKERVAVTQASLGRAIGKNDAWISRRMSGQLPWPTAVLDEIAEFLDVDSLEIQRGPKEAA